MAKAKKEDNKKYSFEVKSGEAVSKYTFRRKVFNLPGKGVVEVKSMFDDKGSLKEEFAEIASNLVKTRSGIIIKDK